MISSTKPRACSTGIIGFGSPAGTASRSLAGMACSVVPPMYSITM